MLWSPMMTRTPSPFVAIFACLALAAPVLAQSVLRQGDRRDWTLEFNVTIRAWQDAGNQQQRRGASFDVWKFSQATVVVPWPEDTSLSRANENRSIEVTVDDREATPARAKPEVILANRQADARYLGYAIGASSAREIGVVAKMALSSFEVTLDDERAMAIEWPDEEWPSEALSALDEQVGIELDLDGRPYRGLDRVSGSIDRLLSNLGSEPRNVSPYLTAKYLTGAIWGHIRSRSGSGLNTARTGEIEGIDVSGVADTFARRRGNDFEVAALLTYVFRRAGLPARMVFGVVAEKKGRGENELTGDNDDEGDIVAWVEFAVIERGRTTWIPVHINEMMDSTSRAPNINDMEVLRKPWEGFGSIKDSQYLVPFSFHAHPPLSVKAYNSPAFWGIFAEPNEPSRAEQSMRINVTSTPVTADSQREQPEQQQTPRRSRGRGRR
ncbi:MAG: transglutaminase-like domain-containing protein [Planctomycetota bacterium]